MWSITFGVRFNLRQIAEIPSSFQRQFVNRMQSRNSS